MSTGHLHLDGFKSPTPLQKGKTTLIGASAISSLFAKNLMDIIFSSGDFASVQNVHLEGQHLMMLLMIGSMIVLVAVGISIFPTQRANPRDTLSKMEG